MTKEEPNQYILKRKKKRRRIILAVLLSILLAVVLFVLKIVLICTAKPTISINYASDFNRISKPANYDPDQDAAFDYIKAMQALVEKPYALSSLRKQWPDELSDKEKTAFNKWITDNDEALAHLERGSNKAYFWLKVNSIGEQGWSYESDFDLMAISQLQDVLAWRSKLAMSVGTIDSAIHDSLTLYRVGYQLAAKHQTHFMGRIVKYYAATISLQLLAGKELDRELLTDFQKQLEKLIRSPDFTSLIETERTLHMDIIQRIFTDDGKGSGHLIPNDGAILMVREYLNWLEEQSPRRDGILREIFHFFEQDEPTEMDARIESIQIALFGPDRRQVTEAINKYFDFSKTLVAKTPWQLQQMDFEQKLRNFGSRGAQLMVQVRYSFLRGLLIDQRFEIYSPVLVTTLAILRYKSDKGQPPENLQQLVDTGYLNELLMDPYGNGPLVYKRNGSDFILYSFGSDFKDDGGIDITNRSRQSKSGDWVFWPVKKKQ